MKRPAGARDRARCSCWSRCWRPARRASLQDTGRCKQLELSTIDARFDVRGTQKPNPDVVIVALDDKTLDGRRRQPDRPHPLGEAIKQLAKAGAKTIAVDIQFTEQSPTPDADNALIEAVRPPSRAWCSATTEVDANGKTGIFGGGDGLKYSGRTPPGRRWSTTTRTGAIRRMPFTALQGSTSCRASRRASSAGTRSRLPAARTRLDRLRRPGGTIPQLSFVDVEHGQFTRVGGQAARSWSSARRRRRCGDLHPVATERRDDRAGDRGDRGHDRARRASRCTPRPAGSAGCSRSSSALLAPLRGVAASRTADRAGRGGARG